MKTLTSQEHIEEWLLSNIVKLLDNITKSTQCKKCGKDIWFVKHANGKIAPYTAQALNHFADCPNAKDFKKHVPQKTS